MLIGHPKLVRDFKKLADGRRLSQGYVFFGPPRVGKGTFARSLGNYLETKDFEPSASGILGDLLVIEPVEGSIGINPVREIKNFLWQRPNRSPYRTLIIDGAADLTDEAQNALLKIAEEPPASSLILVVLDDPERLRPTLQSRFQKICFPPVEEKEIAEWLKKEKDIPAEKAKKAAAQSLGQPGLAYALLADEKLEKLLGDAKKFLASPAASRGTFVKSLLEDESFSLYEFLGAVLVVLAPTVHPAELWHAACELRRQASYFNLNPRLQLLALAQKL